jgi:geranylgeranyl diphosphate synthase type I
LNLISQAELERIERVLGGLIPVAAAGDGLAYFNEAVRSFVLAGGKRVRPQLCLWTFGRAMGRSPEAADEAVFRIACGWELFHAFLLVHDDLIDEAEVRRDRPSLHRHLEDMGDVAEQAGRSLALVAGDLLFSAAMRAFHEADLPGEVYRRQLQLFSRVAMTTGLGQALDIAQANVPLERACERTLLREYHWKTAAYTFEGPMLSGAILAGANDGVQKALSHFALALGQAYQLQNDLIDLGQPAHEGCDLVQGKRTITLLRARAMMNPLQQRRFDRKLGAIPSANGEAVGLAEELRLELLATEAPEQTRGLIGQFLSEAARASEDGALDGELSKGLKGLLGLLKSQYFMACEHA